MFRVVSRPDRLGLTIDGRSVHRYSAEGIYLAAGAHELKLEFPGFVDIDVLAVIPVVATQ